MDLRIPHPSARFALTLEIRKEGNGLTQSTKHALFLSKMASKDDWACLIEQEEGEILVLNLLDEIIERSHQVLFQKHIDAQLLPYAVCFAKNTLMDLIQVFSRGSNLVSIFYAGSW